MRLQRQRLLTTQLLLILSFLLNQLLIASKQWRFQQSHALEISSAQPLPHYHSSNTQSSMVHTWGHRQSLINQTHASPDQQFMHGSQKIYYSMALVMDRSWSSTETLDVSARGLALHQIV
jgi:hypothetical protein